MRCSSAKEVEIAVYVYVMSRMDRCSALQQLLDVPPVAMRKDDAAKTDLG
jgi:hypothetical protein